ncbi:pilus assembly PilX family protein [Dyella sp.]|uniref:pilus assembly PilX family protein n=1 Tax=Dyella sp. TaxID=1869338 RepID=UPI002D77E775|nr:PilX N-terminal domain-containing pilus assembly protein [Dyella sp.]HET7329539.1 PilX N-terminal domain-containing pilus assembly protein [Dyella sp.]
MKAPITTSSSVIRTRSPGPRAQGGVALVVALILLLLITLVGLAAMRGTLMQQKMASNQYDRQIAFQSAEAAVRAATALIPTTPTLIWHNCQAGGVTCLPNPFNDSTLPSSAIHSVSKGTGTGYYTASPAAASQPQFVVENMGNWVNQKTSTGFGNTANSRNYGVQGGTGTQVYYRITARSGDPTLVGDHAVVTIQVVIKQG